MAKLYDYAEVAKHNTPQTCWVILYGHVYDVTDFLEHHPGGSKIILQLSGKDATEEYDPIHPQGTLEENLKPEAKLGKIDPATLPQSQSAPATTADDEKEGDAPIDMERLLNLDDIEVEATKRISHKAWSYYYSAGDDLITKAANNTAYRSILLRPRVFVDCTNCDTSTTVLRGKHQVSVPFYVCPAAMARLAHPDGEHGIAQACAAYGAMQLISHNASMTPEQIVADAQPGQVFGWQIYIQKERAKSEAMLKRVCALPAIKFICLTLDAPVPGKREHDERSKFVNIPAVAKTSPTNPSTDVPAAPAAAGEGIGRALFWGTASDLTWRDTLAWLARHCPPGMPIVLKGLQTHEDALIAASFAPQVKAIILSNHGGRALDTAPPAVHTLLEIRKYCPEVFDKIDVWVDGGIRRGTDVVKALCLGAKAVGVGRAPLYGLGAGGRQGVERVLDILKAETETCMRLLGVERVDQLGMQHINTRVVERDIYNGPANLDLGTPGLWQSHGMSKAKL